MKLHPGILCRVVGGAIPGGLNVGKVVRVASLQGEHSEYGRIWRCTSTGIELISEYGAVGISADFAEDWLEPIPPLPPAVEKVVEYITRAA